MPAAGVALAPIVGCAANLGAEGGREPDEAELTEGVAAETSTAAAESPQQTVSRPAPAEFPESAFAVIRDADDAVFAGGLLSAWPSRRGPTPRIKDGYAPIEGARLLNRHQGVIWQPSQTVLEYDAPLAEGTFERGYFEFVKHPDDDSVPQGTGQYQYDICIDGGVTNRVHLVCEAIGSKPTVPPSVAMFLGGSSGMWHHAPPPTSRPQVLAYLWDRDAAHFYRNGQLVGSFQGVPREFNTLGAREGNNRPEGQLAGFRGAYYSMRYAFGTVPTPEQIERLHAERMERYGIVATEWSPANVPPTVHLDARGKRRYDQSQWNGGTETIGFWFNHADPTRPVFGYDVGRMGPVEGRRINGLPAVELGPAKSLTFQGHVGQYLRPTEYEVVAVMRVDAVASNESAAPSQRDAFLADTQVGAFAVQTTMIGGRPHIGVTHDDGAGTGLARYKSAFVPITLGEPGLLHVQYRGGMIQVRWNDGPVAATTAGPIADTLMRQLAAGRGYAMAPPFQGGLATLIVRDEVPAPADQATERAWLGAEYGIRV